MVINTKDGKALSDGVYISGWWGQYGPARLVQLAREFDWVPPDPFDQDLADCADAKVESIGGVSEVFAEYVRGFAHRHATERHPWTEADVEEAIIEMGDDAENFLNDLLPDDCGYRFGWVDGEFRLYDESEEMED